MKIFSKKLVLARTESLGTKEKENVVFLFKKLSVHFPHHFYPLELTAVKD